MCRWTREQACALSVKIFTTENTEGTEQKRKNSVFSVPSVVRVFGWGCATLCTTHYPNHIKLVGNVNKLPGLDLGTTLSQPVLQLVGVQVRMSV
jgi:hypothetical protein